jgi:membrane protein implicated in regulation of membrane protease activity
MLAVDYPLLNVFWTMLLFFVFVLWIWTVVAVLIDLFRSPDLSGWGKGLWFVFVLFLPIFGVLCYLIARGHKMQEHAVSDAQRQDQQMREYVQSVAGNGSASTADELSKLAALRDQGVLSADEFAQQKAALLG